MADDASHSSSGQTIGAKAAAALDKELMSTGAFSIDQLMELAGLSVSQVGRSMSRLLVYLLISFPFLFVLFVSGCLLVQGRWRAVSGDPSFLFRGPYTTLQKIHTYIPQCTASIPSPTAAESWLLSALGTMVGSDLLGWLADQDSGGVWWPKRPLLTEPLFPQAAMVLLQPAICDITGIVLLFTTQRDPRMSYTR